MRYNTFRQPRGGTYGAFVCTSCSKNIVLEQDPLSSMSTYGAGSILLSVVGSPKPPLARRTGGDIGPDDQTL